MTAELVLRFVLGGAIVSAFAVVGELFRPKTFAGLFGAAPSVAIATLTMAYVNRGADDVATEATSMLAGCAAMLVYGAACVATTKHPTIPVWLGAGLAWAAWGAAAYGAWTALHAVGVGA